MRWNGDECFSPAFGEWLPAVYGVTSRIGASAFYDVPKYVERAVAEAAPLFKGNLAGQSSDQD